MAKVGTLSPHVYFINPPQILTMYCFLPKISLFYVPIQNTLTVIKYTGIVTHMNRGGGNTKTEFQKNMYFQAFSVVIIHINYKKKYFFVIFFMFDPSKWGSEKTVSCRELIPSPWVLEFYVQHLDV